MLKAIGKLRYWEFWPLWLANSPLVFFMFYFGMRARKLFFFTNVNPAFENSGFVYSSKKEILDTLPQDKIPTSVFINKDAIASLDLEQLMQEHKLEFPIIAKPDKGERGLLVEKLESLHDLKSYLAANTLDYILQEYIDLPNEIGIFFHKDPRSKQIGISSVCLKEFLSITGDGKSTVEMILLSNFHGKYQVDKIALKNPEVLTKVLSKNEKYLLEPIGNHSRGTAFYNGNHLIDAPLTSVIESIVKNMDAYYGRFDIKYNKIEELKRGENYCILELNGSASEPTHIYDRNIPIWKKYSTIYQHWKIMFYISKENMKKGNVPVSFTKGVKTLHAYYKYLGGINKNWKTI